MKVSLVVPLRNEENSAAALLDSIGRQTRPPDEVVVVDAGSTDRTAEIVEGAPLPVPLALVRRGELYPGSARNVGVEHARHEWIAFTDGGVVLDVRWLEELCAQAVSTGADVVFGDCRPICATGFQRAAAVAYLPAVDDRGLHGHFVPSMLVRRRALQAVGGFPPFRAAEDLIVLEKLRQPPHRVAAAPGAVIHWHLPVDHRALFRRFSLYSYHNLVARRAAGWHWGVARLYAFLAATVAAVHSVAGGAWAALLLPLFFAARALKAGWRKRTSYDFPTLRIARLARATVILALIDFATLAGLVRWILRSPPRN